MKIIFNYIFFVLLQSFYDAIHPGNNEDELLPSKLGLGFTRSRLYIDCATERDAGQYTCVAENQYLRDSKSGQLFVVDSLSGEHNAICLAKKTFGKFSYKSSQLANIDWK